MRAEDDDEEEKEEEQQQQLVHAYYSCKSLTVGEVEFPFPSGLYLTRVIALTRAR